MSQTIQVGTSFPDIETMKKALDRLGVPYDENAPVEGLYRNNRASIAIRARALNFSRGIGYNATEDGVQRVMDSMDNYRRGMRAKPHPTIQAFEKRLLNACNAVVWAEALAPAVATGMVQIEEELLGDGAIQFRIYEFGDVQANAELEAVL